MKLTRRTFLRITAAAAAQLSAAALAGRSAFALTACAEEPDLVPEGADLVPEEPVLPKPVPAAYPLDPLTGLARNESHPESRIIGVMVNNISHSASQDSRPQRGLDSAGVLIEGVVEGGITRFCALYSHVEDIPEVGPIRSGRDQFLQLLLPMKGLYYHDGESIFCTQYVKTYGYWDLNIGGKSYFSTPVHPQVAHRNNRGRKVAFEHTEFTSGKEIRQAVDQAGIQLAYTNNKTFFPYMDYRSDARNLLEEGEEATKIGLTFSQKYKTYFRYDAAQQVYKMRQYSTAYGKVHDTVDELNGNQLAFTNVAVCFAPIAAYPGDSGGVQQVEFIQGGDAWYFTQGRVLHCKWHKIAPDSRLFLVDAETGESILMNPGKTYLALVGNDLKDSCSHDNEV